VPEVEVLGIQQLEELGVKLKTADRDLKLELGRNIRLAVKPAKPLVQESLRSGLPKRGGLAELMGKATVGTRVRNAGKEVGVQVRVSKGKSLLAKLNEGELRHKVFGHKPWVTQKVEAGLISEPLDRMKPLIRRGVLEAMDHTSRRLTS
jgi:hypothetical protein